MRKSKDRKRQRKQQIETDNGGWAGDGIIIQSLIWKLNLKIWVVDEWMIIIVIFSIVCFVF